MLGLGSEGSNLVRIASALGSEGRTFKIYQIVRCLRLLSLAPAPAPTMPGQWPII